ncbi:MAG: hypothetical protein KDD62_10630, partial [Bdellovibrionales bacterium]|nr:hypothetical protein [Bdellovibrionales bacterium]
MTEHSLLLAVEQAISSLKSFQTGLSYGKLLAMAIQLSIISVAAATQSLSQSQPRDEQNDLQQASSLQYAGGPQTEVLDVTVRPEASGTMGDQLQAASYSEGINQALKQCKGEFVCIADKSLVLDQSCVEMGQRLLQEVDIVIGIQGDISGSLREISCSWFDLLKYWVPNSAPVMLFCSKEVLQRYAFSGDLILDTNLPVAGLFDFIVRTCFRQPFKAIEMPIKSKQLAATSPAALLSSSRCSAEGSRVFNRAFFQNYVVERSISLVVPIDDKSTNLKESIESILKQNQRNFEVILLDNCTNVRTSQAMRSSIDRFQMNWPQIPIRFIRGNGTEALDVLRDASQTSAAPIFVVMYPGSILSEDFCVNVESVFMADSVGFTFPLRGSESAKNLLCTSLHQVQVFNLECLFSTMKLPRCYCMRKLAYLDAEHLSPCVNTVAGIRDVLIRLMGKGWFISDGLTLEIVDRMDSSRAAGQDLKVWGTCLAAQLIADVAVEQEQFDVAKRRAESGMSLTFDAEVVQAAKGFLMDVPPQWWQYRDTTETEILKNVLDIYPAFALGWERLAITYEELGDVSAALE